MDNHYHFVGHLKVGAELRELMRKLHGSVAKLVNDLLPERRVPFWRGEDGHDYFDAVCVMMSSTLRRTGIR